MFIKNNIIFYKIFLFFIILFTNNLFPQVGVKIGLSGSNFYFTNTSPEPHLSYDIDLRPYLGYDVEWIQLGNQKPLFAPNLSIYKKFPMYNRLYFQPELGITQKGVNFSQFKYERIIYKIKLTYIELPILFGFEVFNGHVNKGELYVGGYIAYNINAKKEIELLSFQQTDELKNSNKFDYGINIGGVFKKNIKGQNIVFDIRSYLGLNNSLYVPDNQVKLYHNIQTVKNTGFNLSIGYEL